MSFYSNTLRKKLIFLGTPDVAADVLRTIHQKLESTIQIVAVVSQPPVRSHRGGSKETPSPTHKTALELGIPVLTPISAKDDEFLNTLSQLEPDLCLTAAYGQFLPKKFLSIPKYGTLNIHPSLLPLYRGASPVQRTLENGDDVTGVTLLFSTLAMDAGPIFMQKSYPLDEKIKASRLLTFLFSQGAELFVKHNAKIFSQNFESIVQNHDNATHAKKISKEESLLDFSQPAKVCHNKVRAFDIWPKTTGKFLLDNEHKDIKIVTTEVVSNDLGLKQKEIFLNTQTNTLDIACGDAQILRVKELQEPNKRVVSAGDFINGLHNRTLVCL